MYSHRGSCVHQPDSRMWAGAGRSETTVCTRHRERHAHQGPSLNASAAPANPHLSLIFIPCHTIAHKRRPIRPMSKLALVVFTSMASLLAASGLAAAVTRRQGSKKRSRKKMPAKATAQAVAAQKGPKLVPRFNGLRSPLPDTLSILNWNTLSPAFARTTSLPGVRTASVCQSLYKLLWRIKPMVGYMREGVGGEGGKSHSEQVLCACMRVCR